MSVNASELEQFRQQWQNEVDAKKRQESKKPAGSGPRPSEGRPQRAINHPPSRHPLADLKDESDHGPMGNHPAGGHSAELARKLDKLDVNEPVNIDDVTASANASASAKASASASANAKASANANANADADADEFVSRTKANPVTALEHFERAVEKERSGNLGDSVAHYRKAYRLDDTVDLQYRKKYFPTVPKPTKVNACNAPATVPNPAHRSSSEAASEPLTFSQLIESFAGCQIEGAPPVIAGDMPPPCTISKLPQEVLVELLCYIGRYDPAVLARLALVCKRLAYQIHVDNSIWKLIALGPEFGLASQQYNFKKDLQGRDIVFERLDDDEPLLRIPGPTLAPSALYRDIFHTFPRIRFTGVYISTVNYTRPGGPSAAQLEISNPIHIVTYYRYLRFFRDGTCISLLTTSEPIDVVHHLSFENLNLVRAKGSTQPPTSGASKEAVPVSLPPSVQAIMKHALRGRWRLCSTSSSSYSNSSSSTLNPLSSHMPSENHIFDAGDLHIETEGATSKYRYTIHLALKSASRSRTATKNNKLVWKGFWHYNRLTDDWSEFTLRHDRPFFFSRVKSYGLGY